MKAINVHTRKIEQPKEKVARLLRTLATENDLVWPYENWPAIRFKDGFNVGSKGGHGHIRYTVLDYKEGEYYKFQFTKPDGFVGTHELRINAIGNNSTEIRHIIGIKLSFRATLLWTFIIRWLHDALIEEAFDKVENYFSIDKKETAYSSWVKLLREFYKRKSLKSIHV
ncbi:hypothetical protein [Winogradskyella sp.]|uniref:hypothetical protein n=1 Tax=Winogradskyella sp. TaxID=1883156 RepID=UPI003512C3DF